MSGYVQGFLLTATPTSNLKKYSYFHHSDVYLRCIYLAPIHIWGYLVRVRVCEITFDRQQKLDHYDCSPTSLYISCEPFLFPAAWIASVVVPHCITLSISKGCLGNWQLGNPDSWCAWYITVEITGTQRSSEEIIKENKSSADTYIKLHTFAFSSSCSVCKSVLLKNLLKQCHVLKLILLHGTLCHFHKFKYILYTIYLKHT